MPIIARASGRINIRGFIKFLQNNSNIPLPPAPLSWEEYILVGNDSTTSELTGFSVDISKDGNWVVMGVPGGGNDDTANINNFFGHAYVFNWNGTNWVEVQKLTNPAGNIFAAEFGHSVSINADGTIIAIGIPTNGSFPSTFGRVATYTRSGMTFSLTETVVATASIIDGAFGFSTALNDDGTVLIVGANPFSASGKVYVFKWNGVNWVEDALIVGTGVTSDSNFGYSVDVTGDGNLFIVSAPDTATTVHTFVYRWNGSAWVETILAGSDSSTSDAFGTGVALSTDGNYIAIGAPRKGNNEGAVYIFNWNGSAWIEQEIIEPSNPVDDMYFGFSVSLDETGNRLVIGARHNEGKIFSFTTDRAIFIYDRTSSTWSEVIKIQPSPPDGNSSISGYLELGRSVSISNDGLRVAAGSPDPGIDEGAPSDQGVVYVFQYE